MPLIKRYPNRKLYDTETKQYITLDQIATLIREGQDVQVVDNVTGEDLTALTLTQIILEQEKKQSGFLPRALLSSLIQAGGDRLSALQRTITASIGLAHQIDEEIHRRVANLVSQGELSEKEGKSLLEKLLDQNRHLVTADIGKHAEEDITTEELEHYLAEHQIPRREDLQALLEQLDQLAARIDEIDQSSAPKA